MNKLKQTALFLFVAVALSACLRIPPNPHGAFHTADGIIVGKRGEFKQQLAKAIPSPEDTTLLLFSHGTTEDGKFACAPNEISPYLKTLIETRPNTVLYFHCSYERDTPVTVSYSDGLWARRAEEVRTRLEQFSEYGIPASKIFLVGHSGGASTSMAAATRFPHLFNGIIATAPGDGYAYLRLPEGVTLSKEVQALLDLRKEDAPEEDGEEIDEEHYLEHLSTWQSELQAVTETPSLVYSFEEDYIAPPSDIDFNSAQSNVTHRVLAPSDCKTIPHIYSSTKCFDRREQETIRAFIDANVDHRYYAPQPRDYKKPLPGISGTMDFLKNLIAFKEEESPAGKVYFAQSLNEHPLALLHTEGGLVKIDLLQGKGKIQEHLFFHASDNLIVLIQMPSFEKGRLLDACYDKLPDPYVSALKDKLSRNYSPFIMKLCAPALGGMSWITDKPYEGNLQLAELDMLLEMLQEMSIHRDRVFLIGHDYAASMSLLAAQGLPGRFNAFVALNPGAEHRNALNKPLPFKEDSRLTQWKNRLDGEQPPAKQGKGKIFLFESYQQKYPELASTIEKHSEQTASPLAYIPDNSCQTVKRADGEKLVCENNLILKWKNYIAERFPVSPGS